MKRLGSGGPLKCGCGFQNDEQARFCESCGVSLRERCSACGATVRAQQKFCRACGHPLAVIQAGLARVRTPKHLAERIRSAGLSAEGERKIATALFADIANSTALISDLDAEEAHRILDPAIDRMIDAVHRYEGTITHTAGDGIMAIFGAPIAHEDHALRACYAALDIQEAMRTLAADVRRDFGLLLQVRVGMNSGPVVVQVKYQEGDISVDYRAAGVSTHVAARLESLAAPGTILLTRDTLALAEGFVRVGPFEPVSVKGIEQPVEVCELKGINTRMRNQALAARGLSKFVGREREIEMLARAAAQAHSGRGQMVALVGEAGVGKSRIFMEFTRSPQLTGWLTLAAGSVSYGKATSYLPLVDLLTRYFEIQTRDDERRVREKIAGKLFALGEKKLLDQIPLFLGALGMGVSDEAWNNLTPAERQSQMFAALKQLLIRESQQQPLCLMFEDLHWIDAETQTFLEMLLESVPAARVLLLVNYRPDYKHRWAGKSYFAQARIDPLPAESADELLEVLLGSSAELGPVKKALIEVTEGNPLFLEESVRSLIESGVLAGSPGHWRLVGALPAVFVPKTIEALLAARIDRLQPELKEILQCAAVVGNDVSQALLEAVTGIPRPELEEGVRELQAAEFLYEKALFPEIEYTFKHSMTREVAYSSLLRERKMALHALAARALVEIADGRIDEHVERVAQHAEQGGLWSLAVEYLQRSGQKAYALYANTEAAGFFERALKALQHLPQSRATLEHSVDLRFELRNTLLALAEVDRILRSLEENEPVLAILGDKLRSARHAAFRCNYHFLVGEQRRAIEFGEAGLKLVRAAGDQRIEGELLYRLGQSYYTLGECRRAIELLENSLEFTADKHERHRQDLTVIPSVVARTWLAIALTEYGDFGAGMNHAKRALAIAEQAEDQLSQVLGWLAIGHLLLRKGEVDGAIGVLERGKELCDRWSFRVWYPRVASSLGLAYARIGRTEEGLALAQQALAGAERARLTVDKAVVLVRLGQTSLVAGRLEDAVAQGEQAVEIALAQEEKAHEAWGRFLIGRACSAMETADTEQASKELEAALRLAVACEARPLAAFCQTALAGISRRRGEEAEAGKLAAAADAVYARLGMQSLPLDPVR
jgi:class 3 adenylate cyclase/tetratricopeptide (TPR) repeat protein